MGLSLPEYIYEKTPKNIIELFFHDHFLELENKALHMTGKHCLIPLKACLFSGHDMKSS